MDPSPPRRVLLVVDRSPDTQSAVIATGALARESDVEVVTCRARTLCPSRCGSIESEPKHISQSLVDQAGDALERLGVTVADRLVVTSWGTPSESIVNAAFEQAASMIVVANPSRARLRRRLSGRFVQRLVAVSEIPVLVVGSAPPSRPLRRLQYQHRARRRVSDLVGDAT
jgi:nucleotide-binding universal stress UspA family protein